MGNVLVETYFISAAGVQLTPNRWILILSPTFRQLFITTTIREFLTLFLAMFDLWKRIDELKLDKQICALMMVLVLVNPDRQCPESIRSELEQMSDIQEQFIEGKRSK